jgi:hypothetical protein
MRFGHPGESGTHRWSLDISAGPSPDARLSACRPGSESVVADATRTLRSDVIPALKGRATFSPSLTRRRWARNSRHGGQQRRGKLSSPPPCHG